MPAHPSLAPKARRTRGLKWSRALLVTLAASSLATTCAVTPAVAADQPAAAATTVPTVSSVSTCGASSSTSAQSSATSTPTTGSTTSPSAKASASSGRNDSADGLLAQLWDRLRDLVTASRATQGQDHADDATSTQVSPTATTASQTMTSPTPQVASASAQSTDATSPSSNRRDAAPTSTSSTPTSAPTSTSSGSTPSESEEACGQESGASSSASANPSSTESATASSSDASGVAMPVGDVAGWKQVFSDDFTTNLAEGSFPGTAYQAKWGGYDDFKTTSGAGMFETKKITSVHDGDLDIHLRTENGVALAAAPTPLINGTWAGQKYGRYSVRFKADAVSGYKLAWLLWPDSDTWSDGEVDFPEGDVGGSVNAYVHCLGNPSSNCFDASAGSSGGGWHTATTEWTASGITFSMDGKEVGHTTVSPSVSMHWVLQTETGDTGAPPASASGHVLVDWVSIWAPA